MISTRETLDSGKGFPEVNGTLIVVLGEKEITVMMCVTKAALIVNTDITENGGLSNSMFVISLGKRLMATLARRPY